MNFARIFARISLVFLLKMRPYFARIFTKMSPYEELVTLEKVSLEQQDIVSKEWDPTSCVLLCPKYIFDQLKHPIVG